MLTMPRPVPVLTGDLVRLRPLEPERDAAAYHAMCAEPELHLWTGNEPHASVEDARLELARLAALPEVTMWAVALRQTDRLVGRFFVCLEQRGDVLVAGEGNRIAKPYWRRGHNRDARRLVSAYVFDVLGADRYETECWAANANSRLSILAHGFQLVDSAMAHNAKHGHTMEKCLFAMDRQQYRSLTERSWPVAGPRPGVANPSPCADNSSRTLS